MNNEKQEYMERVKKRHCEQKKYNGFGETHHLREWARRLSLNPVSLRRYLLHGLTIEEVTEVRGIQYPVENTAE